MGRGILDGEPLWSIAHLPAIPEQFRPEIASIAPSMDPGKREPCDAELRGWSMTVKELMGGGGGGGLGESPRRGLSLSFRRRASDVFLPQEADAG